MFVDSCIDVSGERGDVQREAALSGSHGEIVVLQDITNVTVSVLFPSVHCLGLTLKRFVFSVSCGGIDLGDLLRGNCYG